MVTLSGQLQPGPAAAVAAAVRARQVSAVEMVREALDRIARLDGPLNAVVALRADDALAEAAAVDRRVGAGEQVGPLVGVPFLVKDLEDLAGLPTRKGSLLLSHAPPADRDGLVTSRLRAAGAIPVGKTALPEFATEGYTANLLSGVTRNPWSLDHSPGGSSGGSAAALAAGLVPVATATDGGGSIRIPAAFCGLVGLKPTRGVVARRSAPDWIDLSTDGPLATTVADLRLLLAVESGPEPGDAEAWPGSGLPAWTQRPPRRIAVAHRTSPYGPLPVEVAQAFESAAAAFARLFPDAEVLRVDSEGLFPHGDPGLDWYVLAAAEHVGALGRDWVLAGLDRMTPAARAFLAQGLDIGIDDYIAARRRRFEHVRAVDELLGTDTVLLTPTVATAGILADGRLRPDAEPGMVPPEVYSTELQNLTGHPAMSLPAGICGPLPFGLQVTGPRYADGWLLDLAAAWERAHPWPRTAPGYAPFPA